MAKLEGVKTIDMIGGEITKVGYGGAVYERMDEKVREGDLFQLLDGHCIFGGEVGAFYTTEKYRDGDVVLPTEGTGNATYTQSRGWGAAFRKVSAPTIEQVVEKVDALTERVDAMEVKQTKPRTVKRKARVGERILITDAGYSVGEYKDGDVLTVIDDDYLGGVKIEEKEEAPHIDHHEYEVIIEEKESEPTHSFSVGDRVKALAHGEFSDVHLGEIGEITDILEDEGWPIEVTTDDDYDYFNAEDLELVEVKPKTIKRKAKVGERILVVDACMSFGKYKNGDVRTVIKVVGGGIYVEEHGTGLFHHEYEVIVEDDKPKFEIGDYVVALPEADGKYGFTNTNMKLGKVVEKGSWGEADITVEIIKHKCGHRHGDKYEVNSKYFRKATEDEITEATKPVLKVGDFVRVIDQPGHYQNETIVEIVDDNYSKDWPFETRNLDGSSGDIHSAEQLVKVTDEEKAEYEKATKYAKLGRKPGEFKKGDIVRCNQDTGADDKGAIVEIAMSGAHSYIGVDGDKYVGDTKWFDLIAPVESRLDLPKETIDLG